MPGVAGHAVEPVVQALRDGEELGVAVDHDPSRVDPDVLGVAAEEFEHLGHAAPVRGGADVPHPCPIERLHRRDRRLLQRSEPRRADEAAEPFDGVQRHLHVLRLGHGAILAHGPGTAGDWLRSAQAGGAPGRTTPRRRRRPR